MTRKHFQLLANALRDINPTSVRQVAANAVVVACKQANSSFDKDKFLKACGL